MAQRRVRERPAPEARKSSRLPRGLIALGLLAALAFAAATLPASLLAGRIEAWGLGAAALTGSVWNGQAQGLTWRTIPVGNLRWSVRPLSLLRGRLAGSLDLGRADGTARADFSVSPGGRLRFEGLAADLPVETLASFPLGLPPGWRGRLNGRFDLVEIEGKRATALRGTLDMNGLVAPPPRNVSIGSYRVVIPDPEAAAGDGKIQARVTDRDGPFSFEGRFTLGADRSFLLEGTLAPRGTTPPELARSLALLGPADAAGRRPVSVSGTL